MQAFRFATVAALSFIALAPFGAQGLRAQDMPAAEAVAELFFARPYTAVNKTITGNTVAYRGDSETKDADRAILSVMPSRADPCVFEAFFVEGFGPVRGNPAVMNVSYVVSIDLRRPVEVSMKSAAQPPERSAAPTAEAGDAITLRRPKLFCSRAVSFDATLRMKFTESCLDEMVEDNASRMSRMKSAVALLRKACGW
jgi:hypothetical protein